MTEASMGDPRAALDPDAIAALLDGALAAAPRERPGAWAYEQLHGRTGGPELVEALRLVGTDFGRERLAVLLGQHPRPSRCLGALDLLVPLTRARDERLAESAAGAIRDLVARAGHVRASAAAPELADRLRAELRTARRVVRVDLEAALGALTGRAPANGTFVAAARFGLDFLVTEYGYGEPTIDDGGWGTGVIYRSDAIGVVARAEWRDRYADVLLVRLADGDVPMYLGNETTLWLSPARTAGVAIPTYDADSRELDAAFDAWAEALRRCERILRGDVEAFDDAVRAAFGGDA